MTQNDIEQLLEQYGSDQRQQRYAAEHVRHLARRQARRRTALACVAVVAAIVGTIIHRWQQLPEQAGTLVAEQPTVITQHTSTILPSIEPTAIHHPTYTQQRKSEKSEYPEYSEPSEYSDNSDYSDNPNNSDYSDQSESSDQSSPLPTGPSLPLLPEMPSSNYTLSHTPETTSKASRLHFTASVGASTLSETSFGMKDNRIDLTGIEPTTNDFSITTTNAFSANVGVAYTVAAYSRSHLDVGISLSGYSQQGNLHIHDEQQLYVDAMESNGFATNEHGMTIITNNTDEYYTFNTLSLYASVPLSFSLHPRGYNKAGWQLSLTPAHNLVATRHIGRLSATTLNPWKLTVGIGIVLPESVVRHISLTANLLPLYTSHSMHEFGIEIGL